MFVPGEPFQPSLMFPSETGTSPSEVLSGALLQGRLLALFTNIRLGLKGMPGTSTLAYFPGATATEKKSFITLAPFAKGGWI